MLTWRLLVVFVERLCGLGGEHGRAARLGLEARIVGHTEWICAPHKRLKQLGGAREQTRVVGRLLRLTSIVDGNLLVVVHAHGHAQRLFDRVVARIAEVVECLVEEIVRVFVVEGLSLLVVLLLLLLLLVMVMGLVMLNVVMIVMVMMSAQ